MPYCLGVGFCDDTTVVSDPFGPASFDLPDETGLRLLQTVLERLKVEVMFVLRGELLAGR